MRKLIDLSQPIENKGHARPFHPTPVGEAMNFLADAGVVNVGTEAFSIDNPAATLPDADPPYPAHQVCRDRKVLNTENLIIPQELVGRRFTYIGFPIKIVGGTGGWIRAV